VVRTATFFAWYIYPGRNGGTAVAGGCGMRLALAACAGAAFFTAFGVLFSWTSGDAGNSQIIGL